MIRARTVEIFSAVVVFAGAGCGLNQQLEWEDAVGKPSPVAGGGAEVSHIWPTIAARIQQVSTRYGVEIALVGSRAAGTSRRDSDFDYVLAAGHRVRNSAKHYLPRGPRIGEGGGIDIFSEPLDTTLAHILFFPQNDELQDTGGKT